MIDLFRLLATFDFNSEVKALSESLHENMTKREVTTASMRLRLIQLHVNLKLSRLVVRHPPMVCPSQPECSSCTLSGWFICPSIASTVLFVLLWWMCRQQRRDRSALAFAKIRLEEGIVGETVAFY